MPTFRAPPKGTYNRPTQDWYITDSSCVGGIVTVVSPPVPCLDLFNNAQDGSYMYIYKIWVGAQNYGPYAITAVFGHGANLITNGFPIFVTDNQPWGALYWDSLTAAQTWTNGTPANGANYGSQYATDNPDGTVDNWSLPGPVMVVPTGYSCRVWYPINFGTGTVGTLSASFWYVHIKDPG